MQGYDIIGLAGLLDGTTHSRTSFEHARKWSTWKCRHRNRSTADIHRISIFNYISVVLTDSSPGDTQRMERTTYGNAGCLSLHEAIQCVPDVLLLTLRWRSPVSCRLVVSGWRFVRQVSAVRFSQSEVTRSTDVARLGRCFTNITLESSSPWNIRCEFSNCNRVMLVLSRYGISIVFYENKYPRLESNRPIVWMTTDQ